MIQSSVEAFLATVAVLGHFYSGRQEESCSYFIEINFNSGLISPGHVLFEMCAGYELCTPQPSQGHLLDLKNYPQVSIS
jgi:hypothetical protein